MQLSEDQVENAPPSLVTIGEFNTFASKLRSFRLPILVFSQQTRRTDSIAGSLSWMSAMSFCLACGGRLPSEQEWNSYHHQRLIPRVSFPVDADQAYYPQDPLYGEWLLDTFDESPHIGVEPGYRSATLGPCKGSSDGHKVVRYPYNSAGGRASLPFECGSPWIGFRVIHGPSAFEAGLEELIATVEHCSQGHRHAFGRLINALVNRAFD